MIVRNLFDILFTGAIVTLALIAGTKDPIKEPFRVKVCLVASGPNGEDVTTEVWDDQLDRYFEKYPGSYCGPCDSPRACPKH